MTFASDKFYNGYNSSVPYDPSVSIHGISLDEFKEFCEVGITARILREWFCNEMGMLGVQDRYIDAFWGRVPRSILARHYTDYSSERLKRIYDKAGLRVLS